MGQLKQKLVHAAMPHTWLIYMLKHKGTGPGSEHDCNTKSPRCKKSATRQKKHSPGSFLHPKANDLHFPTTLIRKTSLKACREGSPKKQAYRQENLTHANDVDTECGQLQSLYRCTMSPTSRKLCTNADVVDVHQNVHHHLNMPHTHARLGDPCHSYNASKNKLFQLDVKELEMKLNALSAQERWRNTSMSTLPSVAVPSPSLDGELDYSSSHPELDSIMQHPSRRDECRSFGTKNNLYGRHEATHGGNNFRRALNFYDTFLEGDEHFATCRKHHGAQPKTGHERYLETGDREVLDRLHLHISTHDLDHNILTTRYCPLSERKASALINNSPQPSDTESVYRFAAMQSVAQNTKIQKMGYLSPSPIQEKISSKDGSGCEIITNHEEQNHLGQLGMNSSSDDSDLRNVKVAFQNCKHFMLQEKQKPMMCKKVRRYHKHNSNKKNNTPITTPVHNDFDDGHLEFRSELFRSLSTKSLDSSLSHNTFSSIGTSSSLDDSHHLVPAVSGISRQGCIDAFPHIDYKPSILAENVHEPSVSVSFEDLMYSGRGQTCNCSEELDFLAPKRKAYMAAPVHQHKSSAGKEDMFVYNGTQPAADELSALPEISKMECLDNACKKKNGHAKQRITSRLNSLNGGNGTGLDDQYSINDHLHIGSSDDNCDDHDNNDENHYADDECSVSGFDSKIDRAYNVYHDPMEGDESDESSYYYGDQNDLNCLLADDCVIKACGYHADGESDECAASYEKSNCTHFDASESIADATDRRIDEMISRKTGWLDRKVQVQQKSDPLHELLQAEVVLSYNMHQDFKEAIVANIQNINKPPYPNNGAEAHLLELLQCYLALNLRHHHPIIIKAFRDVCEYLK